MAEIRRLWELLHGQRVRYFAALGCLVLAAGFLYLAPLVPLVVLDGVLKPPTEASPGLIERLVEWGGGRAFLAGHLWIALLLVVGLTALAGLFTYLRGRWAARASEDIARRLRDRLYDHLQSLPCSYFDGASTGDLVQRCTSDVETLRLFLSSQLLEVGRATAMLLVPLPMMLWLDVRMTLASVVLVPPIVVFSFIFFRKVQTTFRKVDEAEGRMTARLQENLTGIRVVRAFHRGTHEEARFDARNAEHRRLDLELYRLLAGFWSVSDITVMLQKALVIGLGAWWLARGSLSAGNFYFFLAAVNLFIWPIRMMGRLLSELGKALVALRRIDQILRVEPEADPPPAAVRWEAGDSRGADGTKAAIHFERVGFAYPGGGPVLKDVSFRARSGETLALLGPSGAGKTTLVALLLRLYDPDTGSIRLNGCDITGIPRRRVRQRIAAVLQDPFLYSKTLEENIRLGRAGAGEEEVHEAATIAGVHQNIQEFEKGYRTMVGERGVTLSGGQRQRVALARALLDRPDILILDDALSAVDTRTERLILRALRQRRGRHLTLVIAHRLSTLALADRVLVLEGGRLRQQGHHEELVSRPGLYRRLWELEWSRSGSLPPANRPGEEGPGPGLPGRRRDS